MINVTLELHATLYCKHCFLAVYLERCQWVFAGA